jgi:hypothetical protein
MPTRGLPAGSVSEACTDDDRSFIVLTETKFRRGPRQSGLESCLPIGSCLQQDYLVYGSRGHQVCNHHLTGVIQGGSSSPRIFVVFINASRAQAKC